MKSGSNISDRIRTAAVATILLIALSGSAQVFQIAAGTSSLFNGSGGSLQVFRQNSTSRLDLGFVDGKFSTGFYTEASLRNLTYGIGDQSIAFNMPTDVFSQSHYFQGRGLSVMRKTENGQTRVFFGSNMFAYSSVFFTTGHRQGISALIIHERKLSSRLSFFSRNAVTEGVTTLNGFEFKPKPSLKTGVTLGVAAGDAYWATSAELMRKKIELVASISGVQDGFRRLAINNLSTAETEKGNFRLLWKPFANLRFGASRNHYVWDTSNHAAPVKAEVSTVSAGGMIASFSLDGSLFLTRNNWGDSRAVTVSLGRRFGNFFEAGGSYNFSSSEFDSINTTNINVVERLHPRLALSQVISRSAGQTNISYGGEFSTDHISFSLSYQNTFIPFSTGLRSQFQQMAMVGVRIKLPHDTQLNIENMVLPDGTVRYTTYGTTYAYRQKGLLTPGSTSSAPVLWDNIIAGRVRDDKGQPVAGAAIEIGGELTFSDFFGKFEVRKKKAREYPLLVITDQFMFPGEYSVVSAPTTVRAGKEGINPSYEIVLSPSGGSSNSLASAQNRDGRSF